MEQRTVRRGNAPTKPARQSRGIGRFPRVGLWARALAVSIALAGTAGCASIMASQASSIRSSPDERILIHPKFSLIIDGDKLVVHNKDSGDIYAIENSFTVNGIEVFVLKDIHSMGEFYEGFGLVAGLSVGGIYDTGDGERKQVILLSGPGEDCCSLALASWDICTKLKSTEKDKGEMGEMKFRNRLIHEFTHAMIYKGGHRFMEGGKGQAIEEAVCCLAEMVYGNTYVKMDEVLARAQYKPEPEELKEESIANRITYDAYDMLLGDMMQMLGLDDIYGFQKVPEETIRAAAHVCLNNYSMELFGEIFSNVVDTAVYDEAIAAYEAELAI